MMNNWNSIKRNDERSEDKPTYSRVFVVCSKQHTEEDLRPIFEKFGHIENIYIPRDRNTGEGKGIAYIKYNRTTSAAAAIQSLHLCSISNNGKPIKVMVACQKNEGNNNNEDRYKRLFVKVHKEATEREIREHFSTFGQVESVHLQRNKATDECKGFAYVQYSTFLDAARGFEECDKKYKAIFATPKDELKRPRKCSEGFMDSYSSSSYSDSYNGYNPSKLDISSRDCMTSLINIEPQDYDTINVTCSPIVPQKHVEKLFNIIPGMRQFRYSQDVYNGVAKALVSYNNEKSAAYAVERINNFEFPSGEIIFVKPENNPLSKAANSLTNIVNNLKNGPESNSDLMQLADAIAQASTLIKAATVTREHKMESSANYCNVNLPPKQPLANSNSRVAQRCFLVFKPHPPPIPMLVDAFCRFGDLIEISTFPNKTFGFAKYASVNAAQDAIRTLHRATLGGIKLKVLEADDKPSRNKPDDFQCDRYSDHDLNTKRMKLDSN